MNDWYGNPPEKNVSTLQIVIEGTNNYNAGSSNPMNNKKIQVFDFAGLVAAFDAAGSPSNFNVANNLPSYRLWGSDTEAIGGAIAYEYAKNNSISALTYDQMRAVISAPEFAVSAQSIDAPSGMSMMSSSSFDNEIGVALDSTAADQTSAMEADGDARLNSTPVQSVSHSFSTVAAPIPMMVPGADESPESAVSTGATSQTVTADTLQPMAAEFSAPILYADSAPTGLETVSASQNDSGVQSTKAANSSGGSSTDEGALMDVDAPWFGQLARKPNFHFESLAAYFEAEGNKAHAPLTGEQIAAGWARVRSYTRELGMAAGADDLGAYGPSGFPYGLGGSSLGGEGWSVPVRAAVGLNDAAAANLRAFEGVKGGVKALA